MNIRKISIRENNIRIEADEAKGDTSSTVEVVSSEEASPDFIGAWMALRRPALEIIGLTQWDDAATFVRQVSVRYGENRRVGLSVRLGRRLERADLPLILDTPYMLETVGSDTPGNYLPESMREAWERMELHARRYMDGERAQRQMFPSTANKPSMTRSPGIDDVPLPLRELQDEALSEDELDRGDPWDEGSDFAATGEAETPDEGDGKKPPRKRNRVAGRKKVDA